MSETQLPEPITAWAAFDEGDIVLSSVRRTYGMALDAIADLCMISAQEVVSSQDLTISQIEIRKVTQ